MNNLFMKSFIPSGGEIWIDVSHYQDSINMDKEFRNKYRGIIIKMSQYRKDPRYDYFVWKCQKHNKRFMAYHFWTNDLDSQFQYDIVSNNNHTKAPIWLDVEDLSFQLTLSMRKNTYLLLELIDMFLSNSIVPGIYTRKNIWEQHIKKNPIFSSLPLWVANYEVDYPLIPRDWNFFDIWQFTNRAKGDAYGVYSDKVDLNLVRREFLIDYGLVPDINPNKEHYMR